MVSLERERTIMGASSVTMTLRDAGLSLLRSGLLAEGTILVAWKKEWVLAGVDHAEDRSLSVVFESKRVNDLKSDFRRMKTNATRVSFSRTLAGGARPRIPIRIPDAERLAGVTVASLGVGFGAGDKITIRGRAATREQRVTLDAILGRAWELGASVATMRALVMVAAAETGALNVTAGAEDRGGVLRLPLNLAVQVPARDLRAVAEWFVGEAGEGAPVVIASSVMRRPTSKYAAFAAQAASIVATFLRGDAKKVGRARALVRKQLTEKLLLGVGAPAGTAGESRWDALTRTWTELGWYVFEDDRGLVILSGQHAAAAKPDLVIAPEAAGIVRASFRTDDGFRVNGMSLDLIEAGGLQIAPGMIVQAERWGNANGRYLVASERRAADSGIVSLELEAPAPVVAAQNASGGARGAASIDGVPDAVAKAYARAQAIGAKRQAYVWGGGHGGFNDSRGYDCSGFVSSLLNAGGALSSPMGTGGLNSLGVSGKGQYMTFWVKETGVATKSHTYASFTLPGKAAEKWEAGGDGGPTGLRPGGTIERSGYTPRHIAGW